LCAVSGVAFVYGLVNYLIEGKKLTIPQWVVELNGLCFGIYLFQQFILQILYYKTTLSSLIGPYWLPWIGLIVTLILSYLLTKLSLKTKIGRKLM
jgi:peptidoglycan/LPS O-acetylase OafA/YrhL